LLTLYKSLEDTGESIVSGLYKAKQAHGFNYAMWKRTPPEAEKKGYMHVTNWTGNWIEVDVHGLGTCLMTRKVIEDISTKHGEQWFHWEEPDKPSEDFDFLEKAHGCGYKCWVRTDVVIEHEAKIVLNTEGQIRVGLV
jgi:hypothetical protein